MHAQPSYPFRKQKVVRRRRAVLRSAFVAFLLSSLLILITPGLSVAQAARFSKGSAPHHWTPAQVRAIQQALKKQIHVTHTGHRLAPVTKRVTNPLRPRQHDLPPYNNTGISDPPTRQMANFDGASRSYAAQALQDVGLYPGVTVTSQNITFIWPSVPTGQPDNYQAAEQILPVTAPPGVTTVGFLGASTGGSSSGLASLNYQQCSSTSFTLGLTDWWSNSIQFNNQQVAAMTTIDTKHGTKTGNFYLYSATTAVNPGCTLTSVTLPATTSPGQVHIFAVGVGGPNYTNIGITDNSNPTPGDFDGSANGNSYSAQALSAADLVPNQQFDVDGIAYSWPDAPSGTVDNSQASGQIIPVTPVPGATTVGVLGAATNGDSSGAASLNYADGTDTQFTLGFADWAHTSDDGDLVAATFSTYNSQSGNKTGTRYLFAAEESIATGETLVSVTLPSTLTGGQLHVFALGTRAALNNLGSSNDSQPGEGNFDGGDRSWSIQALEAAGIQQGQPFIFNGVTFTWPASYGTLADNAVADGQIIPVTPVPNATTLAFLGAATNSGSSHYASGTATITYTDTSTQTIPLNLTDWWNPTPEQENQIAVTCPYINTQSGRQNQTVNLYYTEVTMTPPPGQTIQSVTLPATVSAGQMHIFAVGTRSAYNNIGISDDSNPSGANFDGGGNSYSAQDFADAGWNPGDTLTYEGINYVWPDVSSGQGDNYQADGQVIPVSAPAGATTLGLVGAATYAHPSASGTVTLNYANGSHPTFTLSFADWAMDDTTGTIIPPASNRLFALLPHYNNASGTHADNRYLFEVETPLDDTTQLQSVTLPTTVSGGNLNVFMLGTRTGENYPNDVGTSDDGNPVFANFDIAGRSYSIEALEAAGLSEGQPFTFNGVTFIWPASYSVIPDNYQTAAGQVIPVTPVNGATTLAFLGAGTNSGSSDYTTGIATITYTDTSTQNVPLTLTDWWNPTPEQGNQIAATCSYINTQTGIQNQTVNLYYTEVTMSPPPGQTIQSVTLPATVSAGQMHIFAIGTK